MLSRSVQHIASRLNLAYFSSVTTMYAVTLLLVYMAVGPYLPRVQASPNNTFDSIMSNSRRISAKTEKIISGKPVFITIPKLDLKKGIEPGIYDQNTGTWSISPAGVHYAQFSSKINDRSGNTLLYAHNNKWAFGLLYLLKSGDKVLIKTDSGYTFTYSFKTADDFDPHDTTLFTYAGPPVLTLQTCSGLFNEYRRLYTFRLETVERT